MGLANVASLAQMAARDFQNAEAIYNMGGMAPGMGVQPQQEEEKGFFGKIGDAIKGLFSSTMGGQATGSTIGGIAGAALGLLGGPIGMMIGSQIGSALGSAVGGAIGRGNQQEQMQEMMQQYQQAGANMQNQFLGSYSAMYMNGGLGF